jgi:hypothetical protein
MVTFQLYKNKNNTDVAFMPIKTIESDKQTITYKGYWFNIVNNKHVYKIVTDEITVKRSDIKNWAIYKK